jgi:hypothetical protein
MLSLFYCDGSLISTLYEKEVSEVFLDILLRSQNEELRKMISFTIITVCGERFRNKSTDDDIFKLRDPRTYFLEIYIPLIEDCDDQRMISC